MNSIEKKITHIIDLAKHVIKERDIPFIKKAFYSLHEALPSYTNTQTDTAHLAVNEIGLAGKALTSIFLLPLYKKKILTKEHIIADYGEKVFGIVNGVSRVETIDTTKSKFHSENFIKLILTQADDVRVILILLTKKLYALKNIEHLSSSEQIRLCEELSSLYAPISHRLGLYQIKTEMEEMSMKYLHYDIYKTIAKKLADKKKQREEFVESFIEPIKKNLEKENISFKIFGRPKSISSIWNKIKKSDTEFENIYDLFAIRIIIDSPREYEKNLCWHVYSIVSDIYTPNPKRLRDWISTPKRSGYESLHTTVLGPENKWVEVQIRTQRMDDIAEKGHAAHWKYKEGEQATGSISWLASIRNILESASGKGLEEDSLSRMELYSDEIFVFTPKDDLYRLRKQATVLDFAYEIHSEIGNTCTAGKVNGKIVPLKHTLHNGDKIEIITSKQQNPKQDWLTFVKTSKAQQRIKKYLYDIQYKNAEVGKEILARKLQNIKVKFGDNTIHSICKKFGYKHANDLYIAIYNNKIDFTEIKQLFSEPEKIKLEKKSVSINSSEIEKRLQQTNDTRNKEDNLLIIEDSLHNIDYKFAKCCNPIKGDEIFGFISAGGGIKIHRLTCPNAAHMLNNYPYRIIKTEWTNKSSSHEFNVGIRIIGSDEIAIVNRITQIINHDFKIPIRNFNISSRDGNFEGLLSFYISNNTVLEKLLEKLRSIKGVHSAERYDSYA
ncbi:MAG: TGS domain-containing protein [Bacteroidales bacterium]|jgi:guanosine-3',5'-bis(diphosphate) 3'-pyrophosphohydrolase|nr:TGS domain-containing protein [Bacteroidales bacterium]